MTQEQVNITNYIYNHFNNADLQESKWTVIDEYMSYLDYLEDNQVVIEAEVKLEEHLSGSPKCKDHDRKHNCLVPKIIEAVKILINNNKNKKKLQSKDRFTLQYYLAISQAKFIVS